MADSIPEPVILDSLGDMVHRAMHALAGMQLDLFTPLKDGPLSADQIAASIGVHTAKLRPLLYALVVVGLLTVEDGLFTNTAEADHYLVRGRPGYRGNSHKFWQNHDRSKTGPRPRHCCSALDRIGFQRFFVATQELRLYTRDR